MLCRSEILHIKGTWSEDRKSTRLNSSHSQISYAVFCLKKKIRFRMRRSFGMKMLSMPNLSTSCLFRVAHLGYDATPFSQILQQYARCELSLRLDTCTVS